MRVRGKDGPSLRKKPMAPPPQGGILRTQGFGFGNESPIHPMVPSGDEDFYMPMHDPMAEVGPNDLVSYGDSVLDPNSFIPGVNQVSGGDLRADDLASTIDSVATNLDDILSKVKLHPNQTGMALLNEKGCQSIELFDVPLSWKALHDDAVKRVGHDLSRKDEKGCFEFKAQYAVNTVMAILAQPYKPNKIYVHKANGEPHFAVWGLTGENFVGELVELDDRVIHLNLFRVTA